MTIGRFLFEIVLLTQGLWVVAHEVSRVEVDLDAGLVTGYSERVQFDTTPTTPPRDAGKKCSRPAVIRVELGGRIQVAKILLHYSNPQLWTFHVSDSPLADGYGDVFLRSPNQSATTELSVTNQQLRIYTHFPTSTTSSWADVPTASSQWMYLRVVDDTVHKKSEAELTLELKTNTLRWQDGRMTHEFTAPPGLFEDNETSKKSVVLYVAMNRIVSGDWRSGSGLCRLTLKLLDTDEDQCEGAPTECDPNAVCKQSRRFHRCSCRKGWEGDGKTCKDVDECRLRNGGCVHRCHNLPGAYSCSCHDGFRTDPHDDHNCLDVDECTAHDHACRDACVNTVGSYECACDHQRTTPHRRHCQLEESPCFQHGCHHTCSAGLYGNMRTCTCWSDYQLNLTDGKSCIRKCRLGNGGCQHHCLDTEAGPVCTCQYKYLLGLDGRKCTASCSVNNGGCQKRCANTDVGVVCSCPNGYVLNADAQTCSDVDECAVSNGGCQHQCLNGIGHYECVCPRGYRIDPADERTCMDVDECSLNDTCEHTCTNVPGSYVCTCRQGYQLFSQAHCGDIDECFLSNGGYLHDCVNTPGGYYCSDNSSLAIHKPTAQPRCTNNKPTTNARARLSLTGIVCSQVKDTINSYAREFLDTLESKVTIKDCQLQVANVKCFNSKNMKQIFDIVKVGLRINCLVKNEPPRCLLHNCTASASEQALLQTVSLLRASLDGTATTKIRNYELSVVPKSFHVKEKRKNCLPLNEFANGRKMQESGVFGDKRFKCPAGHVWHDTSQRCEVCVKGTYTRHNACWRCPENSTTDDEAATGINSCKRFQCKSYINDLNGFIESPNYPGNYPDNVECTWVVKPPKGRRLLVIIPAIHFAGNKCEDHIVMRKSKSPYSVITYEACKTVASPLAFIAESKRLWIRFRSDSQGSAQGFHIPFVTYNEEYQSLIEDIVQDRRLYSLQNHLEILRDKKLLDALIEVIAQPINYYKYSNDQRKMFPSSFIRLMTPKVRKFFSYKRRR